jgi:hypothetical protein
MTAPKAAAAIPARYAKFITAAIGQALVYLQIYGWAWHIKPASLMIAAALGVLAVPNAVKPATPATPVSAGMQTYTPNITVSVPPPPSTTTSTTVTSAPSLPGGDLS